MPNFFCKAVPQKVMKPPQMAVEELMVSVSFSRTITLPASLLQGAERRGQAGAAAADDHHIRLNVPLLGSVGLGAGLAQPTSVEPTAVAAMPATLIAPPFKNCLRLIPAISLSPYDERSERPARCAGALLLNTLWVLSHI